VSYTGAASHIAMESRSSLIFTTIYSRNSNAIKGSYQARTQTRKSAVQPARGS